MANSLTDSADQLSRSRVKDLLHLAQTGDLAEVLANVSDNQMAQVADQHGRVLAASPNITGRPAVADLVSDETPRQSTFKAPDDQEMETYRVWHAPYRGRTTR